MKIVLGSYDAIPHEYHHQFLGDVSEWLITDIYPRHKGITEMDARNIPHTDVEALYASHLLEHIKDAEVFLTLKHWYNVLKPGGWVHINVPDMEWALDNLMRINSGEESYSDYFDTKEKMWEVINGTQESYHDTHKSWFTKEKLLLNMKMAGFKDISVDKVYEAHDMQCLIAKGYKQEVF